MFMFGIGTQEIFMIVIVILELLVSALIPGFILYAIWRYYNARSRALEERVHELEKRLDENKKGQ